MIPARRWRDVRAPPSTSFDEDRCVAGWRSSDTPEPAVPWTTAWKWRRTGSRNSRRNSSSERYSRTASAPVRVIRRIRMGWCVATKKVALQRLRVDYPEERLPFPADDVLKQHHAP